MRFLFSILVLICISGESFAGSCDCSPEIENASATVTTTCSKTWSDNQCSLDETGASASQLIRNPEAISVFDQQIDGALPLTLETAVSVWRSGLPGENFRRCTAGGDIDQTFLQSAILLSGLRLNEDGEAALLSLNLTENALSFAQEFDLAEMMCLDSVVPQDFQNFTAQYGRGCLIFGEPEQYFELNLNLVGSCPFDFGN